MVITFFESWCLKWKEGSFIYICRNGSWSIRSYRYDWSNLWILWLLDPYLQIYSYSNINDTPRSPWYKIKWSHLLSSGMQLPSENFSHIENDETQKKFGESFMEIKANFFCGEFYFQYVKSFHCLQLHSTTQKWLNFVLYQGLRGVSWFFLTEVPRSRYLPRPS